jgi:predicted phage terminase large subunit-like protein
LDVGFYASMLLAYPSGHLREQEIYGDFVSEGGTLGDSTWFNGKVVENAPQGVDGRVRYWDLAASEKKIKTTRVKTDPDETCGSKVSMVGKDRYLEDQVSGYWEWLDIREKIKQTALRDGPYVKVVFEEEPGSGGKNQVAALVNMFKEDPDLKNHFFTAEGYRPEGDRVMLANVWFAEAANGQWYMVEGDWNKGFLRQLDGFPIAKHDDKITSVSCARAVLKPEAKSKAVDFLHL